MGLQRANRWGRTMVGRVLGTVLALGLLNACGDRESPPDQAGKVGVNNLIIYIGDGMGPQAVGLLNAYAKYGTESVYRPDRVTWLERAMASGVLGMVYHEAANVLVADSAASATQMASGKWALPETIGIDVNGEPVYTVLDRAKDLGKATGLVSDTRLTHATPAAFAAHQTYRGQENEIASELLETGVDVMLSGGLRHFIPRDAGSDNPEIQRQFEEQTGGGITIESRREDDHDLLAEAARQGYGLAHTRSQLSNLVGPRILGLFASSGLPFRIDFDLQDPNRTVPSLPEMTDKALQVLAQHPRGFFLVVESGIIDWVAHHNDAGSLLHEMIRFDETLQVLLEFVENRDDTLLLVSADHETGGFGFSYSRRDIPQPQPFPGRPGESFSPRYNYGSYQVLEKLYRQETSFAEIFEAFDEIENGGPRQLMDMVNQNLAFPISLEEAERILAVEENRWQVDGHAYLAAKEFPRVDDLEAFYVSGSNIRRSNLGRVVAEQQNVVWSTGTHTATPVPLIALGPPSATEGFGKLMHTTEWAQQAFDLLQNR